jgi:hypothetical protein
VATDKSTTANKCATVARLRAKESNPACKVKVKVVVAARVEVVVTVVVPGVLVLVVTVEVLVVAVVVLLVDEVAVVVLLVDEVMVEVLVVTDVVVVVVMVNEVVVAVMVVVGAGVVVTVVVIVTVTTATVGDEMDCTDTWYEAPELASSALMTLLMSSVLVASMAEAASPAVIPDPAGIVIVYSASRHLSGSAQMSDWRSVKRLV